MHNLLRPGLVLFFLLLGSCHAQLCSSLVIPLNVFTRDGLLVRGISPSHLRVKVHGDIAQIESLSLDLAPRRVVLLLDTSGSMAGNGQGAWRLVPELASYAVDTIPPNASVAVGTIGKVPNIGEFGDRAQAGARIRALTRGSITGQTPLLDSLHLALLKLDPPHFGDVVYLVSDGGDNSSQFSVRQIRRQLAARGTRIFALIVANNASPPTVEQSLGPPLLEGLVEQTGGHFLLIPWTSVDSVRREHLLGAAPLVQSEIGASYRLQLSVPTPINKIVSMQVRYIGPDQRIARTAVWIYPHRIGPCSALSRP